MKKAVDEKYVQDDVIFFKLCVHKLKLYLLFEWLAKTLSLSVMF